MKIEQIQLTRVRIPLDRAFVSSRGIRSEYQKTIIEVVTDSGLIGVGETVGSKPVYDKVREIAGQFVGSNALDRSQTQIKPQISGTADWGGAESWAALGGIEMALWDLIGKRYAMPVCYLLGGGRRQTIPMVCELSAGPFTPGVTTAQTNEFFSNLDNVDAVVEFACEQASAFGYHMFKLKTTGFSPEWDMHVMSALRESFGPAVDLRYDPNGAYATAEAINVCRRLEPLKLQWFEDPTAGLEGMRRLRQCVSTPVATNMCVTELEDLPAAIRLGGIDVVGIDAFHWGGLANARDAVAVCDAFGLDVFMHCFFDLSVTTAANLHFAAGLDSARNGVDTCLYLQSDDVICGGKFQVHQGELSVPVKPGLGIELDAEALRRLAIECCSVRG